MKFLIIGFCYLLLLVVPFYIYQPAHAHFVKPEKGAIGPVCGMSVSEDPSWVAVIMFSDGKHVKLHGTKCMFTYYFNLAKYDEKRGRQNVATMHVMDYRSLEPINAKKAYYVIHSNIKGPMGDELIPLKDRESAEAFIKENGGKILLFKNITPETINSLNSIPLDNSSPSP
jgi:nitrous oxide reductase accessory protein NosL